MNWKEEALLERIAIALESIAESLHSIAHNLEEINERGLETYDCPGEKPS